MLLKSGWGVLPSSLAGCSKAPSPASALACIPQDTVLLAETLLWAGGGSNAAGCIYWWAALALCISEGSLTCLEAQPWLGAMAWEVRLGTVMLRRAPSMGITHTERLYRSPARAQPSHPAHTDTNSPPASLGAGVFDLFRGGTSLTAGERCLTALWPVTRLEENGMSECSCSEDAVTSSYWHQDV